MMSDYSPPARFATDRTSTRHAPDLLDEHIEAADASAQHVIVEDRVIFDHGRNLFVWAGAGAELTYDECEALGLDGTGRRVTFEGRHAVRAVRYRDIEITEAAGITSPSGRYLIERAQSAYDVLGAELGDAILGPGGLSGATAEQLDRLIDDSGREEIRNHDPRLSPAVAAALRDAASALWRASEAWQDNDQVSWDGASTHIRDAFGMSLEEVAAEIDQLVIDYAEDITD